jgi:Conserved TM helix
MSPLAAVDFGQGISNAWSSIATFVPKLLAFLVILFIGWLIAKAIAKIVDKVLERAGFDRVVERGGINRMMARSKYDASDIIAKLLYYAVLLITLQIAFGVWGPNPVSAVLTGIVAWLPRAVVAIVIIVVAGAVARAVRDLLTNALGGLSYGALLGTLASVFVWGLGIIAALNQIGVAMSVTLPVLITVLATIGGIAVVGVGGGLIRPMQARWDRWLGKAEEELPQARAMADAYQRGREDAARTDSRTDARADTRTDARVTQPAHAGRAASDVTRAYPPQGNVPPGQQPRQH